MEKHVRGLVKEAEPKDVFPSVEKAHLNERLRGRKPARSAVGACTLEGLKYHDPNPGGRADPYKRRLPLAWIEPRQSTHFTECIVEASAIEGLDVDGCRLDLARPQPCGESFCVALNSL